MASSSCSKQVTFSEQAAFVAAEDVHGDDSSSDEEFYEITTSEAESLSTSGEEDAEMLEMALDGAYSCCPSLFSRCLLDPAERTSLLLQDKDFLDSEADDTSVDSEISCSGDAGCGTASSEASNETSSEDETSSVDIPRKKRRSGSGGSSRGRGRGGSSRGGGRGGSGHGGGRGGSGRGRGGSRGGSSRERGRGGSSRGGGRGGSGRGRGGSNRGRGQAGSERGRGRGGSSCRRGRGGSCRGHSIQESAGDNASEVKWKIGPLTCSADEQPASHQLPPFKYPEGPSPRTKDAKTPLQTLQLFLTVVILDAIVQQTKLFASQKGKHLDFCVEELMAFIGINVAMGMLRLPRVRDYWSTNSILSTPWFPSVMARDRFFFVIMRYLHVADSSLQKQRGEEGYDPLFKVRVLIDHLTAVFSQYYQPSRYISIDERMIGTRCRVAFLQYIPKKPTRFGIKVWINSESKSGYVLTFQVYTGSHEKTREKGLGYRVVKDLMEHYQGKGHCLFVDNFYASAQLLLDLLEAGTYCTGTVRSNRKNFPVDLIPSDSSCAAVGSCCFATEDQEKIVAVWWRDRRDVLAMSTMHNTSVTTVMKRPKGGHQKRPLPCPTLIADYNSYMGGVDLTDQYLSYYSMTTRRTLKWWKKVFWRLVDMCILNSWIIIHYNNPSSALKSHRDFRLKLIEELAQTLLDLRASTDCPQYLQGTKGRRPGAATEKRLTGKHFAYKNKKRGWCSVCSQKISLTTGEKKDTKTQNYCKKCNVFLCAGDCFEKFHTRTTY